MHCIVLLSQVLLFWVGSLFLFYSLWWRSSCRWRNEASWLQVPETTRCASFVKSRMLHAHYKHISYFFNKFSLLSLYVYNRGILGCLRGRGQNPAGAIKKWKITEKQFASIHVTEKQKIKGSLFFEKKQFESIHVTELVSFDTYFLIETEAFFFFFFFFFAPECRLRRPT